MLDEKPQSLETTDNLWFGVMMFSIFRVWYLIDAKLCLNTNILLHKLSVDKEVRNHLRMNGYLNLLIWTSDLVLIMIWIKTIQWSCRYLIVSLPGGPHNSVYYPWSCILCAEQPFRSLSKHIIIIYAWDVCIRDVFAMTQCWD